MAPILSLLLTLIGFVTSVVAQEHKFTLKNNCGQAVKPVIANTNCGYSPRCDTPGSGGVSNPAKSYNGAQPSLLGPGASQTLTVNNNWNGRIFNQSGKCGSKGEGCTVTEFNLDTGSQRTPQAYDISNIQGFTDSVQISVLGCETVTCTNARCGCTSAYPQGDVTGCGNDLPVRGCSAGGQRWTVTFCP